jgi:hypothetical protein
MSIESVTALPFENAPHARILGNSYHPSFGGCAKASGMIQSFLFANSFEIDGRWKYKDHK